MDNGVKELVVQPTHLMHGAEYDELVDTLADYEDKFDKVSVSEPLLGQVGRRCNGCKMKTKPRLQKAITAEAVKTAGYDSLDAAKEDKVVFVFMGHGTSHAS